jgi:hypothetical protein
MRRLHLPERERKQVRFALAALLVLVACGERKREEEAAVPLETAAAASADNPIGTTLTYTRSNQDGTKPERILVHTVSLTELHVAKMVEPCTDAAYVTATFDPATKEATRLVGGRLTREGTQAPQAYLDLDPKTRKLTVRLGDPVSQPAETHDAPPAPWRMYDFDLAEFALFGQRSSQPFDFGLAMAWPDGSSPVVRILGSAHAAPLDSGQRVFSSDNADPAYGEAMEGILQPFTLYAVSGPAFADDGGGFLWLNSETGHVIEASFTAPNHPGYADFMLKLTAIDRETGPAVWREALAAHWKDC